SVCLASAEDRHFDTVGVDAVPLLVDRADTSVLFSLSPPTAQHNRMGFERHCPPRLARLTE
ncbi:MAG: hypothetical protein ABL983_14565, partial [Nitrospira sp.]